MISEAELSPSGLAYCQQMLRKTVWYSLDCELFPSAEFAGERLLALDPSNLDSIHLMAYILYRQAKYKSALRMAQYQFNDHIGCSFIRALCLYQLGRYDEAVKTLDGLYERVEETTTMPTKCPSSDRERCIIPDMRAIELWAGKARAARGSFDFYDQSNALKYFASVAIKNPYLYESVDHLAKLRVSLKVDKIFKPEQLEFYCKDGPIQDLDSNNNSGSNSGDPFTGTTTNGSSNSFTFKTGQNFLRTSAAAQLKAQNDAMSTPTASSSSSSSSDLHHGGGGSDAFATPSDGSRGIRATATMAPQKRATRSRSNLSFDSKPPAFEPPKRQVRASTIAKRTATRNASSYSATTSTAKKANTSTTNSHSTANTNSKLKTVDKDSIARNEAAKYLSSLYTVLTQINVNFHKYRCKEALAAYEDLSEAQKNTPWVLAKMARTHFELVNYSQSLEYFQKLHEQNRFRVEDMEYFSTLLWHLQKDYELAYLSYDIIDADRTAPQGWCALGNSFSLKKEPDLALKCFARAIQLDPDSPYAYTLQAHEHISNDAYENAQESFRKAIKADNRHYNAWYGLGMVAMRLGQIEQSEIYFKRAAEINPNNVVLICCIGMAFEKKGMHVDALDQYERACQLQPKSALSRYRKARALINLKWYNDALKEFDDLCTLAPDEASVHFLLGQLYKVLQNREKAVKHFTIALNLDPKGSHLIKEALAGLSGDQDGMTLSG